MNPIKTLILTLSCFFSTTLHADQPNIIFIFIDDTVSYTHLTLPTKVTV